MRRAVWAAPWFLVLAVVTGCTSTRFVAVPEPVAADHVGATAHYMRVLEDITAALSDQYPALVFTGRLEETRSLCVTADGGRGERVHLPIRASGIVLTAAERRAAAAVFEGRARAAGFHDRLDLPAPAVRLFASDGSYVTLNGTRSAVVSLTIGCYPQAVG
ncbi:hypothetical protein [Rhodococcus yananensis]|uniref:hypothetical protein n=1 Tax=Rhodococcus yananensis TaxID=2879464 RepID=UPI003EB8AF68